MLRNRIALPVVLLVAALLAGPASGTVPAIAARGQSARDPQEAREAAIPPAAYVAHQLLVRFGSGVGAAAISELNARLEATTARRFDFVPGLELLELEPGMSVPNAVAAFSSRSEVLYAQPNWVSHIDVAPAGAGQTPNDPKYRRQWDWPKIGAPAAWDLTTGSHSVVVGDIDTGIDYNHEDLKANVWQNSAECDGMPGVDDDHNGYVDDCHGIDTINHDSDPMDDNGHGSHTGGTIGAVGNNGLGVTGINWGVQILPCKSHDSSGNGSAASIIECYQYMVTEKQAGYDIIATNNSYGGCPEACAFDQATSDGIAAMGKAGILFAAAAGNYSDDNDTTPFYPASYFLPNVISVAATNRNDRLAGFSNYGVRSVMVGAPGVNVLSTFPNDGYGEDSGTSMATPHVAGLAALIHAKDPSLNIYRIRNLIIAGGDDVASLANRTLSGKRIDALGSLTCKDSKVFGLLEPLEDVPSGVQTIAVLHIDCAQPAGGLGVTIEPGNVRMKLADDGKGADLRKKDGIYSVAWNPAGAGTYTLKFSNGRSYTVKVIATEGPVRR